MLPLLCVFSFISTSILASIPYELTCGTPKCLDYNDGCNECSCQNSESGTVVCTERACFAAGTPVCRKCQKGSFWLRYDTFQAPGFATCDSRFLKSPEKAENNSKCACPKQYPFWEEGVGCINAIACDANVLHQQDTFNYLKFIKQAPKSKCSYDYQLCTTDKDCGKGLICNKPTDNYETCIPLNARLDKNCELKDCSRCLFDDCMGAGYGYCASSMDCKISGCSKEICAADIQASDCGWKCEYGCLHYQQCGRVDNKGSCGWKSIDKKSQKLYRECLKKCKPPNDDICASNGRCYDPIGNECSFYAPCPRRDYCNDEFAPTCAAYPDAECVFTACGGCSEFFVDSAGDVIEDCDGDIDICLLAKEIGPCDAAFIKHYYNGESGNCEEFTYGGCGGRNNFVSLAECQHRCDINLPDCVAEGYSFLGDVLTCQRIRIACPFGWEFWSDFVCGCGCKPTQN